MATYDPLRDSRDTLMIAAIATLTDAGYTWNQNTTSFSEYLATALTGIGGSTVSNRTMSITQLLAGLVNELDAGPVSHLTSSFDQLLALLGGAAGTTVLPLHSRIVFEGDSITAGSSGPQFAGFAHAISGGRFFRPSGWNQGTGGQTAAQMATQVANVTALNPKVVVLLAGTNDLSGSADSAATIFANIRTCVEAYKAAGARVVNVAVLPRNDGVWDAGEETRRQALNALILAQTDVTLVNVEATFNPTTMCLDGLHPNFLGAKHIGTAVAAALNTLIDSASVFDNYLTADNFLVGASENPQFAGTGGTKSGTPTPTGNVPNNWTVNHNDAGGALTVVASITTLNGRPAIRVQVSGSTSATSRVVNITNTVAYTGQAGDFWEVWWDFLLASGSQNVRQFTATTDTTEAVTLPSSGVVLSTEELSGVMRPAMGTALAGVDTSVSIQIPLTFDAIGTVSADFTVAAPYYRKVPSDGGTLQSDTGVDILADTGTPILVQ